MRGQKTFILCIFLIGILSTPQLSRVFEKIHPVTLVPLIPARSLYQTESSRSCIALIVNDAVWANSPEAIMRFAVLLETRYFEVILTTQSWVNATDLRTYLQTLYAENGKLEGAILIGDLPVCWYVIPGYPVHLLDRNVPQFLMDLYLMDLDGEFADTDADGFYNVHFDPDGSGPADITPDIWVSRIVPPNPPPDWSFDRMGLLEQYLNRLPSFLNGSYTFSNQSLVFLDNDWWYMDSEILNAMSALYSVDDTTRINGIDETTKERWLEEVSEDYAHGLIWVHAGGTCYSQKFLEPDADHYDYLWFNELRQYAVNIPILILDTCKVTNFTHPDYQAGWYLFGPGQVATLIGASRDGGMYFYREYFEQLARGNNIGQAFLAWFRLAVNQTFESWYNQIWWRGMTLLGDPTISLAQGLRIHAPRIEWVDDGLDIRTVVQHPSQGYLTSVSRAEYQVLYAHNSCTTGITGQLNFNGVEWQALLNNSKLQPGNYTITCHFEHLGSIGTSPPSTEFEIPPLQAALFDLTTIMIIVIVVAMIVVCSIFLWRVQRTPKERESEAS